MAIFRTYGQIVKSMRDRLKLTQINLDTKPGTVARDLFIDIQADELSTLYQVLSRISDDQDPSTASGDALKRWANNFGIRVDQGSPAQGMVVFSTNVLNSDEFIPDGSLVFARNGASFKVIGNHSISVVDKNVYAANASRLRSALDQAGITDSYALEVPVVSTSNGVSGNIASFQVISHSLSSPLNIINLTAMSNGVGSESEDSFRAKILTKFSGSGTGTADAYKSLATSVQNVYDALVVSSGSTLMLRDGTQVIGAANNTTRILNSGSGGMVDLYILGKKTFNSSDSFVFSSRLSLGGGQSVGAEFVPGYSSIDSSFTVEEVRFNGVKTNNLPVQPIERIVSVSGSRSGLLSEMMIDSQGVVSGNYKLTKDVNVTTGGSVFGKDRLTFISGLKSVSAESLSKNLVNASSSLKYSEINDVTMIYQDLIVTRENASVISSNRSMIYLSHYPVINVSKVYNETTGETYVITNQNLDPVTGLNLSGSVTISGRSLPSPSDILSVNYSWRMIFDEYIDFNGKASPLVIHDPDIIDAIDWGVGNTVRSQKLVLGKTSDNLEFIVDLPLSVSKALSVSSKVSINTTVAQVIAPDGNSVSGIVIAAADPVISNISSIRTDSGVEIFNIPNSDGYFEGRTIYLPSNVSSSNGVSVVVEYNKVEMYKLQGGNGSVSGQRITLPSEDQLRGNNVFTEVENSYLAGDTIFVDYVANNPLVIPSEQLSLLPAIGSYNSDGLILNNQGPVIGGVQPILYSYNQSGVKDGNIKYSPSKFKVSLSGISSPGKIKISGTTLTRMIIEVDAGVFKNGLTFNISEAVRSNLRLQVIPDNMFLARIDDVIGVDGTRKFDLSGTQLFDSEYSFLLSEKNTALSKMEFVLPNTSKNVSNSFTPGEKISITFLLGTNLDSEDVFFSTDGEVITRQVFGRIDRISVTSGLRSLSGIVTGSISVEMFNQPTSIVPYFSDYNFIAPKEGELITVLYSYNSLVGEVSRVISKNSVITADIIVKEGFSLPIDVYGEIVVNDSFLSQAQSIVENVSNAISGALSSSFGGQLDYSDLIIIGGSISGVDSLNISTFNESGKIGRRTYIKALDNQSLSPGIVSFKSVSRKDFRIS